MIRSGDFYKFFYQQWASPIAEIEDGYSLILLTPGDLPFFAKIALEVCQAQDATHLVETIIVPDSQIRPGFSELIETWAKDYTVSPLKVVKFRPLELLLNRYHRNPFNNCWHQLIRGIEAMSTTHGLLHDVDLFMLEPDFLKRHYEAFIEQNIACLGVSKVWDSWYEAQGIDHIVATWELMFDRRWARSFQPWEHRAHDGMVAGQLHAFDMMLCPQCQTPPEQIKRHEQEWGFIHFSHVVSSYRRFQQSKGAFEDSYFRLLLIRLLINAYDRSGWSYDVPTLSDLTQGITDPSNRVTYLEKETWEHYPEFRSKLQKLLDSSLLNDEKISIIKHGVNLFDQYYLSNSTDGSCDAQLMEAML